jgi:hypothetical protein
MIRPDMSSVSAAGPGPGPHRVRVSAGPGRPSQSGRPGLGSSASERLGAAQDPASPGLRFKFPLRGRYGTVHPRAPPTRATVTVTSSESAPSQVRGAAAGLG